MADAVSARANEKQVKVASYVRVHSPYASNSIKYCQ